MLIQSKANNKKTVSLYRDKEKCSINFPFHCFSDHYKDHEKHILWTSNFTHKEMKTQSRSRIHCRSQSYKEIKIQDFMTND